MPQDFGLNDPAVGAGLLDPTTMADRDQARRSMESAGIPPELVGMNPGIEAPAPAEAAPPPPEQSRAYDDFAQSYAGARGFTEPPATRAEAALTSAQEALANLPETAGDLTERLFGENFASDALTAAGDALAPSDERIAARGARFEDRERRFEEGEISGLQRNLGDFADVLSQSALDLPASFASGLLGMRAGRLLGGKKGAAIGAAGGSSVYSFPQHYQEALDNAMANGLDVDDPDVYRRVIGTSVIDTTLDNIVPLRLLSRQNPQAAQELIRKVINRDTLAQAGMDGIVEATTELGQMATDALLLDPELRAMLSEQDIEAIMDYVPGRYARDAFLAVGAGGTMGAGFSAGANISQQAAENARTRSALTRIAGELEPLGVTGEQLTAMAEDPKKAEAIDGLLSDFEPRLERLDSQRRALEEMRGLSDGGAAKRFALTADEMTSIAEQADTVRAERDALIDSYAERLGAPLRTADLRRVKERQASDSVREASDWLGAEEGIAVDPKRAKDPQLGAEYHARRVREARDALGKAEATRDVTSDPADREAAEANVAEARTRLTTARTAARTALEREAPSARRILDDEDKGARDAEARGRREQAVMRQMEVEFPEGPASPLSVARAEEIVGAYNENPPKANAALERKIRRFENQRRGATTPEQIDKLTRRIDDLSARREAPPPAVEAARRVLREAGQDPAGVQVRRPEPTETVARDPEPTALAAQPAPADDAQSAPQGSSDGRQESLQGPTASATPSSPRPELPLGRQSGDRMLREAIPALDSLKPRDRRSLVDLAFETADATDPDAPLRFEAEARRLGVLPDTSAPDAAARVLSADIRRVATDMETRDAARQAAVQAFGGSAPQRRGFALGSAEWQPLVDLVWQDDPITWGPADSLSEPEMDMLAWSRDSGKEMSALIGEDGRILGAGTNGLRDGVMPPENGWATDAVLTHTHVVPYGFSANDVRTAMRHPGRIRAILPDGTVTQMRRLRPVTDGYIQQVLGDVIDGFDAMGLNMPLDRAQRIRQQALIQALEAQGVIDYDVPYRLPPEDQEIVNDLVDTLTTPAPPPGGRGANAGRGAAAPRGEGRPDRGGGAARPPAPSTAAARTLAKEQRAANPERIRDLADGVREWFIRERFDPERGRKRFRGQDDSLIALVRAGDLDLANIDKAIAVAARQIGNKRGYVVRDVTEALFPGVLEDPASISKLDRDGGRYSARSSHTGRARKGLTKEAQMRASAALVIINGVNNVGRGYFYPQRRWVQRRRPGEQFKATHHEASEALKNFLEFSGMQDDMLLPPLENPDDLSRVRKREKTNAMTDEQLAPAMATARRFQRNRYRVNVERLRDMDPIDLMSSKGLAGIGLNAADVRRARGLRDQMSASPDGFEALSTDDKEFYRARGAKALEQLTLAERKKRRFLEAAEAFERDFPDQPVGFLYQVDDKGRIYAEGEFNPQSSDSVKSLFEVDGVSLGDMPTLDNSASGWQVAALMARDEVLAPRINLGAGSARAEGYTKRDMYLDTLAELEAMTRDIAENGKAADRRRAKAAIKNVFDAGLLAGKDGRAAIKTPIIAVNYAATEDKFRNHLKAVFNYKLDNEANFLGTTAYNALKRVGPKTMEVQEWAIDTITKTVAAVESPTIADPPVIDWTVGADGTFRKKKHKEEEVVVRARTEVFTPFEADPMDPEGLALKIGPDGEPIPRARKDKDEDTSEEPVMIRTNEIDAKATARSVFSQIIQGFDASILHRAVQIYDDAGGTFVTSNHDAYTVPRDQEGLMAASAREAMAQVMEEAGNVPERIYNDAARALATVGKTPEEVGIRPPPELGNYDFNDVRSSTPLFTEDKSRDLDDAVPPYAELPLSRPEPVELRADPPRKDPDGNDIPPSAFDMYRRVRDDTVNQSNFISKPSATADSELLFQKFARSDKALGIFDRVKRSLRRNVVTDQGGLMDIEDDLGMQGALVGEGMSRMVQMLTNESSRINSMLHYAVPKWNAAENIYEPRSDVKPLAEILKFNDTADYTRFSEYAYAKRDEAIIAKGKGERMMPELRASALDVPPADAARYDAMIEDYQQFNRAMLEEAREAGLLSQEQFDALVADGDYLPMFRVFENAAEFGMQEFFGKSGLTHPDPGVNSLKENPLRIGEKVVNAQGETIAEGGKLGDLVENMQRNAVALMLASTQNRAHGRIYDFMTGQLGHEVDTIEQKTGVRARTLRDDEAKEARNAGERDAVMFYRNGQKVYWKATGAPEHTYGLSIALAGLRPPQHGFFVQAARKYNEFARVTITSIPVFALRSYKRDMGQAYIQAGVTPDKVSAQTAKMVAEGVGTYSDATRELMLGAGVGAYQMGGPAPGRASSLRDAADIGDRGQSLRNLWRRYEGALGGTELGVRRAVYDAMIEKGFSKADAMYEARNYIDYGRRGGSNFVRGMTHMVLFLNPRIQGVYRIFETTTGDNKQKLLAMSTSLAARGLLYMGLSAAAANLMYFWPPEEGEDENEWVREYRGFTTAEKAVNMHIPIPWEPGRFYRMPRPFELGSFFGSIPMTAMDASVDVLGEALGLDSQFYERSGTPVADLGMMVRHTLWETFSLNPIPEVAVPFAELIANRSFWSGIPITSTFEQGVEFAQRNAYTGPIASEIGRWLPGLSPIEVQHLLDGYFGPMGMYFVDTMDMLIANSGVLPPKQAARLTPLAGIPYIGPALDSQLGTFLSKTSGEGSTRFSQEYYSLRNASEDVMQTINADDGGMLASLSQRDRERLRRNPEARALYEMTRSDIFKESSKALRDLRKERDRLRTMDDVPREQRDERLRLINARMAYIQRSVVEEARRRGISPGAFDVILNSPGGARF